MEHEETARRNIVARIQNEARICARLEFLGTRTNRPNYAGNMAAIFADAYAEEMAALKGVRDSLT